MRFDFPFSRFRGMTAALALAVLCAVAPRPASAAPAAPLPACLVDVSPALLPSSATAFSGAAIPDPDADPSPRVRFDIRWWANPADIDKTGLVLVLSYTRDAAPTVVRSLTRPLPPAARGHQTAVLDLPDPSAGPVLAWRAAVLQRGRVLSLLQTPDWNSAP